MVGADCTLNCTPLVEVLVDVCTRFTLWKPLELRFYIPGNSICKRLNTTSSITKVGLWSQKAAAGRSGFSCGVPQGDHEPMVE